MGAKKEKKTNSKAAKRKAAPVVEANTGADKVTRDATSRDATSGKQSGKLGHAHHMAWYQMLRAHTAVNHRIERRLASEPVSLGWYDVLVTLEKAPDGRLRMSELADNVVLSRSGLTRLVDRLEKAGLLRREKCEDDRRGFYAVITPEGRAARRAAWPRHSRSIAELFARHLSEDEANIVAGIMQRVADAPLESDEDEAKSESGAA